MDWLLAVAIILVAIGFLSVLAALVRRIDALKEELFTEGAGRASAHRESAMRLTAIEHHLGIPHRGSVIWHKDDPNAPKLQTVRPDPGVGWRRSG